MKSRNKLLKSSFSKLESSFNFLKKRNKSLIENQEEITFNLNIS